MKRIAAMLTLAAGVLPHLAAGETVKCRATRDVWLSAANKQEVDCNMGAARTIKLKVWQEFGLVDFDVSELKGKRISAACVCVKPAGGHKLGAHRGLTDLKWLTVSTVSHDWVEGKSTRYAPDPKGKGASFNEWSHGKGNWGFEGAKCWNVILGNGNTLRDDQPMEVAEGWLRARIDPALVQALVAGASHGLLLMDGSTSVGVNCRVGSRESENGPYLEVVTGGYDRVPPAPPRELTVSPAANFATATRGAIHLSLKVPAGAFAYHVKVNGKAVGRWQVPFPGEPGGRQTFPILDLPPSADVKVAVAAADASGNVSAFASASGKVSGKLTVPELPACPFRPKGGPCQLLRGAKVWAFPEVTKVHPVSGEVLGEKVAGDFRKRNAVWDGAADTVRLAAARGEIVSFQVAVEGEVKGCSVKVSSPEGPGRIPKAGVRLWRNGYVQGQSEYAIPLTGTFDCPAADNAVEGQKLQAVTVDLHVPTDAKAGDYAGTVTLAAAGEQVKLKLKVKVYDVALPEAVFFNPELNCYGGPGRAGSAQFKDSFRLAHYHRCTINRVPYNQRGNVHGDWVPRIAADGHVTDWSDFDRNLGGLLDGSWFAGNPRAGVPVPTLYLPLFEGWPKNFRKHYHPGDGAGANARDANAKLRHDALAKPIDQAMDTGFKNAWVNCTRDFVKHATQKKWSRTIFQCYLNNKPNYGYTLWTLDEPFEYLDWAALNFFARLYKRALADPQVYTPAWHRAYFRKGLAGMKRPRATFLFRGDISRLAWQGSVSDGLMNIIYLGGGGLGYPRIVRDTKRRAPTIMYAYGSCNDPARSNWESAAWCLKAYTNYCDGVLPWQSLGGKGSMQKLNKNGLIIHAGDHGHAVGSFRVHALRRGAQDCELLRLLQLKNNWSRDHIGVLVAQKVPLTARYRQAFVDEAAAVTFQTLTSQGFCELKEGVLQLLAEGR